MTGDQAGLLVLAGTLVVATAGAWDLVAAGATREELRERATGERSTPLLTRIGWRLEPRLRAHAARPAPADPPRRRRAAAARAAGGAIALAAALAGYFVASFIVGHLREHRRRRARDRRALDVAGAQARAAPRRLHGPAPRARADPLQRRLRRPVDGLGLRRGGPGARRPGQDRAADRPGGDPHRPALRARDGEPRPAPALARAVGPRHDAGHPAALRRRPRARAVGHGGDARGAPRDPARGQDPDGGRHRDAPTSSCSSAGRRSSWPT